MYLLELEMGSLDHFHDILKMVTDLFFIYYIEKNILIEFLAFYNKINNLK